MKCIYCGDKAVRWCDFVIGFLDPDGDGLFSFDDGSEFFRCDAPLCLSHAKHRGNIFFCGTKPAAGIESVDHCFGHAGDDSDWFEARTAAEAEQIRYRHRCVARGGLRSIPNLGISVQEAANDTRLSR